MRKFIRKFYPHFIPCLRIALGICPACHSHPVRAYACYVCGAGLIARRFWWGRWQEELTNP